MIVSGNIGSAPVPPRPPLPIWRFVWIAFPILLAALGVRIVTFALGDLLPTTNPSLSVLFDAGQVDARVAIAERLLQQNEASVEDAISQAQMALRYNPLSSRALTVLGRAAANTNKDEQAFLLFQWANRASIRDLAAQLWLLQRDIRAGSFAAVMDRLDVILRANDPRALQSLIPALTPLFADERFRTRFVALAEANAPWRSRVLNEVSQSTKDIASLNALFTALQAGNSPPSNGELKEFLARLLKEGWVDQAYLAWSKSLPADRLQKSDYLYNGRLQYPLTNVPFDWLFEPIQGALIGVTDENSRRVLSVDFFGGRVPFRNVSHLLSLPPGAYKFAGQERAQNLLNDRGLTWRIYCLENPDDSLAVSSRLTGDTPWRAFNVDLKIPDENCRYQNLVLELRAQVVLQTEISGGVSFSELRIEQN